MSPQTSTKETDNTERDVENLKYLMDYYFQELIKTATAVNMEDPHSVLYTNAKVCVWLKGTLLYMGKHHVIDDSLHRDLTRIIKSFEHDADFFNEFAKTALEKEDTTLSIFFKREIHGLGRLINQCSMMLHSLIRMKLEETEIKVREKEVLQRQGEKLRKMLDKQRKESEEKMSQYVA